MREGFSLILALLLIASASGGQLMFHDDFSSYPDGSSGEPGWEPLSIGWMIKGGRYVNDEPVKVFTLISSIPPVRRLKIEATLTVRGKSSEDWKVAGVAVYKDGRNNWHLALVESPDSQGARHFFELQELYEGTWLAQNLPQTKLAPEEGFSSSSVWEYGKPYRLRLTLTPRRILGEIFDSDGRLLFRQGYKFDNPRSVSFGRPALDNGGFIAAFDDVKVEAEEVVEMKGEEKGIPEYGGCAYEGIKGEKTGFFHIERKEGEWWVIDPNGCGFFAIGTDHIRFTGHWCEKLGYAPYHKNNIERYGTEGKWAERTIERLLDWGFNLLGAGHSESLRYRGLAHTLFLSFGSGFASYEEIVPKVHWTGFPNVFSPKFERYCDMRAREVCSKGRDDPWLFGYFLDNELEWYGKTHKPWGIFSETVKKPPKHTAKRALIDLLKRRYHSIDGLNEAWGTEFKSFDEMLERNDWGEPKNETMERDAMDFVALTADRYFSITTAAIRRYDPNHMILGCRFAGDAPEPAWKGAGRYCDIVTLNFYGRVDLETGEPIGLVDHLKRCYELSGRPLMITEWSFPALDSGLPCKHGAGMRVDTQEQKARCFRIYQTTFFSLPFVVGSDYFMWVDEPALGISSTFPEDSNYGLVNERDEPYWEFVNVVKEINRRVYEIRERGFEGRLELRPEPAPWPKPPKGVRWIERVPILLENPREVSTSNPFISLSLDQIPSDISWSRLSPLQIIAFDSKGEEVPIQIDSLEEGRLSKFDEICLRYPLQPGESKTVYLYLASAPVREGLAKQPEGIELKEKEDGIEISNGSITLVKLRTGGDLAEELKLNGVSLGRIYPLLKEEIGGEFRYPAPDSTELLRVSLGPLRAVLWTSLRSEGKGSYRATSRVAVYPGRRWVEVRLLRIENVSEERWRLHGYFVFAYPQIGGSTEGDEVGGPDVPNYYLNFGMWVDREAGMFYGASSRSSGVHVRYWIDTAYHADAFRPLDRPLSLSPGSSFVEEEGVKFILFGGRFEGERPWSSVLQDAFRSPIVHLYPPEK
ncbi:TPA: hypothetical protein EYP37_01660 [Candidatus Poribacteria bacterium]|nr:hypothetical protein [Candidatus Poribacteria bacterium]